MSLPSKSQIEKEIANATDPEVKKLLQRKLDHVNNVEPLTGEELAFFIIITVGTIGMLAGLGYIVKLVYEMQ